MEILFAQLADALSEEAWYVIIAIGLLAPAVGLLISVLVIGPRKRRIACVGIFYVFVLPLAALVIIAGAGNLLGACTFLIMLPIGLIVGVLVVVLPFERIGTKG